MSEMSEKARSEAKEKVKRLTSGGKDKIDASGWTQDEYGSGMMHNDRKLGNRPISKQNLATGGRAAFKHGGRKGRDMGGATPPPVAGAPSAYAANAPMPPQNRFSFTGQPSPFLGAAGMKKGGKAKRADGGKADGHWMEKAFSNSHGQLHKELGVKAGEKIPAKKLDKAEHSDSGLERKRANLVKIAERSHKADGGQADEIKGDRPKGGRVPKASGGESAQMSPDQLKAAYAKGNAENATRSPAENWKRDSAWAEKRGNYKKMDEMGRKDGGRAHRASGGSAGKGKMNVNIIIAQKPEHPPMGPPGMGGPPPGMPPRPPGPMPIPGGPPPGGPPPGMGAPPPGGPPPANMPPPSMARASGGKVYPKMEYGAGSGCGRLEKIGKRP